jgi:hypothetical protein
MQSRAARSSGYQSRRYAREFSMRQKTLEVPRAWTGT